MNTVEKTRRPLPRLWFQVSETTGNMMQVGRDEYRPYRLHPTPTASGWNKHNDLP